MGKASATGSTPDTPQSSPPGPKSLNAQGQGYWLTYYSMHGMTSPCLPPTPLSAARLRGRALARVIFHIWRCPLSPNYAFAPLPLRPLASCCSYLPALAFAFSPPWDCLLSHALTLPALSRGHSLILARPCSLSHALSVSLSLALTRPYSLPRRCSGSCSSVRSFASLPPASPADTLSCLPLPFFALVRQLLLLLARLLVRLLVIDETGDVFHDALTDPLPDAFSHTFPTTCQGMRK